jgi:hypothetical protein
MPGLVVAGDDDEREPQAGARELALQIETAGTGHLQVEHQAVGRVRLRQRGEKVLCRPEGVGIHIGCAQQPLERLPHRFVVVDRNAATGFHHDACRYQIGNALVLDLGLTREKVRVRRLGRRLKTGMSGAVGVN